MEGGKQLLLTKRGKFSHAS